MCSSDLQGRTLPRYDVIDIVMDCRRHPLVISNSIARLQSSPRGTSKPGTDSAIVKCLQLTLVLEWSVAHVESRAAAV